MDIKGYSLHRWGRLPKSWVILNNDSATRIEIALYKVLFRQASEAPKTTKASAIFLGYPANPEGKLYCGSEDVPQLLNPEKSSWN